MVLADKREYTVCMPIRYESWNYLSRSDLRRHSRRSFPFIPGVFFLALGMIVLLAPKFFVAVLASVFFFIGFIFCYAAWKFIQFKRQIVQLTRDLDGKIQVQAFHVHRPEGEGSDDKKIVYH